MPSVSLHLSLARLRKRNSLTPLSPPERIQTSPCFQLALTFTGLQKSARAVFDPAGLVEALRLEKGDQQDASE
jgi:ubiquitin carboxyl-terminal hydrolase 48